MCCCPEVSHSIGWGWKHAGALLGASEAEIEAACTADLSWERHAASWRTAERPQQRWGPLCSMTCASQIVSQAERDAVSRPCLSYRILLSTQAAANEFNRNVRQEASTKTSKRDGFQEEARHTCGFAHRFLHPTRLARLQHGAEGGAGRVQGGYSLRKKRREGWASLCG